MVLDEKEATWTGRFQLLSIVFSPYIFHRAIANISIKPKHQKNGRGQQSKKAFCFDPWFSCRSLDMVQGQAKARGSWPPCHSS
jgi:predicted acetyltransferase